MDQVTPTAKNVTSLSLVLQVQSIMDLRNLMHYRVGSHLHSTQLYHERGKNNLCTLYIYDPDRRHPPSIKSVNNSIQIVVHDSMKWQQQLH